MAPALRGAGGRPGTARSRGAGTSGHPPQLWRPGLAGLARLQGQALPAVCPDLPASGEGAGSWTGGGGPGAGGRAPPGSSRAGVRRPSQMSGVWAGGTRRERAEAGVRGPGEVAQSRGRGVGGGAWKSPKWGERLLPKLCCGRRIASY